MRLLEMGFFERIIQGMSEKEKAALLPEFLRAMQSNNSGLRNNALVALQRYPEQAKVVIPVMINALQDSDQDVRVMAVKALNEIDPQTAAKSDVVQILVECLLSSLKLPPNMPSCANEAVITLGKLHREPDLAVPALVQSLQSADIYVRQNSAHSLGEFGNRARPAAPALLKALEDSDVQVRKQAAAALKRIESEAAAN